MVTFSVPKLGSEEWEWEDGAASSPGDPGTGVPARLAVADGAAGGIGSARWAAQLVSGFVGLPAPCGPAQSDPPALNRAELVGWLEREQGRWREDPHWSGASGIALRKLREVGSLATVLGCELVGLGGRRPSWRAFALGDTVLFHVREGTAIEQFPSIPPDGFGSNPDGVPTRPERLPRMLAGLQFSVDEVPDAALRPGDQLFVATDALAEWLLGIPAEDRAELWARLGGLDHPEQFRRLVADARQAGLHNDDVTLLRVALTDRPPRKLVVCL